MVTYYCGDMGNFTQHNPRGECARELYIVLGVAKCLSAPTGEEWFSFLLDNFLVIGRVLTSIENGVYYYTICIMKHKYNTHKKHMLNPFILKSFLYNNTSDSQLSLAK